MSSTDPTWDAIVIGSGIGGLSCAAALARTGHRVLMLEQHSVAGGLTQTFSRDGFTWAVGLHYLGEMEPGGAARRVVDWLSDGHIQFTSAGAVYDTLHFPGDFEFRMSRPEPALKLDLKEKFPGSTTEIDAVFDAIAQAQRGGRAIFARRAMPAFLAGILGLWRRNEIRKWWRRTSAEVLEELVTDARLRAVLLAQRGDYGGLPRESSFGIHATIMHHYFNGAFYPVGGAGAFAAGLIPVIEDAGGRVTLNARVRELITEQGAVVGVQLGDGTEIRSKRVFSDAGAHNTVGRLLPAEMRQSAWAQEVLSFKPSVCHIGLYLGLEGDIRANGATASNHWIYETWDPEAMCWEDPFAESRPPAMFVSFPTLKDAQYDPGKKMRHTAEIVVMTNWETFSQWQDSGYGDRPEGYGALKDLIGRNLLAHFRRHFPALASMILCHELSTPLSTASFIGAPRGAIYGLETIPRRFLSDSLRARTPVPGLFLAGQDVVTPGVTGAMMGGLLAAAAVEPRIFMQLS